jgi:16S rRNA (uracil1498-N3)-methyltransferase
MRVNRFLVDQPLVPGMQLRLPDAAAAHLVRVLRAGIGDACVVFNGDGHDHVAHVVAIGKRETRVEVGAATRVDNESPLRIVLVQALARGEKMDLILQKATELGVAGFIPVMSERSEVRLDGERVDKRLGHWRSVVGAACEQCGRATVPPVATPVGLATAMTVLPPDATRLLLDPEAPRAAGQLPLQGDGHLVLAIGPEGGWSPRDRATLQDAGFVGMRLGPRILRTETAGLAAIAALQSRHGDLG